MIAKDLKYISCQFLRGRDLFRKPIISINPAESPVVERLDTSTARPASELSEASEAPLGPSKEPVITHSMIGFSAFRKLLRPLKWPLSAHLEWIVAIRSPSSNFTNSSRTRPVLNGSLRSQRCP